jgi:hypothetical protein
VCVCVCVHYSMCIYLCSKFKLKFHTIYLKPELLHPNNCLEAIIVLVVEPPSLKYSFDLKVNVACD